MVSPSAISSLTEPPACLQTSQHQTECELICFVAAFAPSAHQSPRMFSSNSNIIMLFTALKCEWVFLMAWSHGVRLSCVTAVCAKCRNMHGSHEDTELEYSMLSEDRLRGKACVVSVKLTQSVLLFYCQIKALCVRIHCQLHYHSLGKKSHEAYSRTIRVPRAGRLHRMDPNVLKHCTFSPLC